MLGLKSPLMKSSQKIGMQDTEYDMVYLYLE